MMPTSNPTAHRAGNNPFATLARSLPSALSTTLSYGGRLAGVAALLFIAADQTYDRTQAYTMIVSGVVLISLIPAMRLAMLGAALLLFSGAMLYNVSVGPFVLIAGVIAVVGVALASAAPTNGHIWETLSLLGAAPLVLALIVPLALVVEG